MREDTSVSHPVLERLSSAAESDQSVAHGMQRTDGQSHAVTDEFEKLIAQLTTILPAEEVAFDERIIKENLEEILLVFIALHGEAHGKQLLADLSHVFDAQLSPGTVYPCLHTLEELDVLSMHAKVRTKEYAIADTEYTRATIEETMMQHLAFGMLLYGVLDHL